MQEILNRPGPKVRWINFAAVIGIPYTLTGVIVARRTPMPRIWFKAFSSASF